MQDKKIFYESFSWYSAGKSMVYVAHLSVLRFLTFCLFAWIRERDACCFVSVCIWQSNNESSLFVLLLARGGQQCQHLECWLLSNRPDASVCHSEHEQSCLLPPNTALTSDREGVCVGMSPENWLVLKVNQIFYFIFPFFFLLSKVFYHCQQFPGSSLNFDIKVPLNNKKLS